jgi:hypothetical protein
MNNTTFISGTNSIVELQVAATADAIIELEVATSAVVRSSSTVEKIDPKIQVQRPALRRDLLEQCLHGFGPAAIGAASRPIASSTCMAVDASPHSCQSRARPWWQRQAGDMWPQVIHVLSRTMKLE